MKTIYHFIHENPRERSKTIAIRFIVALLVLLFGSFFYAVFSGISESTSFAEGALASVNGILADTTPIGLFYAHFIGGIFFVPSADELIFYYGLLKGNPLIFSFAVALIGYMLAQVLNYFIGSKLSPFVLHLVSKKKVYKVRRVVNKYGAYGIFLFNLLPLPAPLLIFALGMARYNFKRLLVITFLAKCIEYAAIIGIYLLISG